MKISKRGWMVIAVFSALVVIMAALKTHWLQAANGPQLKPGQLTATSLGNLLAAMGLEPKRNDDRYDFTFKALHNKDEWGLSMSAVLSQDGESIWLMAWLDELPRSAADVPRTALLRLLANNDRMGNGKFFAYVASNRRFVLQRVVHNHGISTASFRDVLKDLGTSVVLTYPHWSVANWIRSTSPASTPESKVSSSAGGSKPVTATATSESKFAPSRRK